MKSRNKLFGLTSSLIITTAIPFSVISCSSNTPDVGVTVWQASDPFMSVVKQGFEKASQELGASYSWNDAEGDQTKNNDKVESLIASGVKALAVNLNNPAAASTPIKKAKSANIPLILWNKEASSQDMSLYDKVWYVGTESRQSGEMQIVDIAKEIKNGIMKDRNGNGQLQYFIINGEAGHPDATARTEAVRLDLPKELAKEVYQTPLGDIPSGVKWYKSQPNAIIGKSDPVAATSSEDGVWAIDLNSKRVYIKKGAQASELASIYRDIDNWENATDTMNATDWSSSKGSEITESKLESNKDNLDFIAANNDGTAVGAVAAIKRSNDFIALPDAAKSTEYANSNDINYMPIFGVDNTTDAEASMKQGWLTGTVLNDGIKQGFIAMAMAINASQGKTGNDLLTNIDPSWYHNQLTTPEKAVRVDYVAISRDTLDQFK